MADAVVLDPEPRDAEPAGQLGRLDQRGESAVERERPAHPRTGATRGSARAMARREAIVSASGSGRSGIVHRLQRTQTLLADRDRCRRLRRAAEPAGLRQRPQGRLGEGQPRVR